MKPALDHHYANSRHHPEWEDFNLLEWKDIEGYEGIYQISNYGDVKNLTKNIILKSHITPKGYLRIQLSKEGKSKSFMIHRLVAIHFIEKVDNKPQVNHKDTNKKNNYYENLEWCDNGENQIHAYANNLQEIKYAVKCVELDIITMGCGEMERKLKEAGYNDARDSSIRACINETSTQHMGLHFEGFNIEEYRRSKLSNMTLLDLVEMICDWKASTLRHNDGNILTSIDKNQDRFGYSSDMAGIFKNTVKLFE